MGLDAVGSPRLFFRPLRAENVDESLADVCVFGSHTAAQIHFDVFAVAQPDFAAGHFDEAPDPNAGLKGRSPDRHAVAGDHLAGHAAVFATDENLSYLRIRQVTVVYNETVVKLHERGVLWAGVESDHLGGSGNSIQ